VTVLGRLSADELERIEFRDRREVHLIFDGPPGPDGPRFIEAETPDGRSVRVGEWRQRPDGLWALVLFLAAQEMALESQTRHD
jgi:hypothetical protein